VLVPLQPLVPLAKPSVPIVIDSISGVSGAGRGMKQQFHFPEMNENVWAYGLTNHRHTPEMEQELGGAIQVQFSPHVGPYIRGIVSTITVRPSVDVDVDKCYARYKDEPFVRVLGEGKFPDVAGVRATNFVDFGWIHDKRTGNLVIVSAVDNLMGGTAGMAIQCMNLMFGLNETDGLLYGGMTV
jgi:N-acetyl-gamma-glutamyl-phosphate reductase